MQALQIIMQASDVQEGCVFEPWLQQARGHCKSNGFSAGLLNFSELDFQILYHLNLFSPLAPHPTHALLHSTILPHVATSPLELLFGFWCVIHSEFSVPVISSVSLDRLLFLLWLQLIYV